MNLLEITKKGGGLQKRIYSLQLVAYWILTELVLL